MRHSANANSGGVYIAKSRNATIGSNTIVQDDDELGRITFSGDDGTNIHTQAAAIHAFVDGTPGENDMPGRLTFYTTADGAAAPTERLRISSTGQVLIGTSTPSGYTSRLLTVAAADGDSSIELRTATDHAGQISFTDGSAGDATNYRGYIQYNHDGDYMRFGTLSTERIRIDSSGRVVIGLSLIHI